MKRGVSEIVVLVVVACFFFLGVAGTKAAAEDKIPDRGGHQHDREVCP